MRIQIVVQTGLINGVCACMGGCVVCVCLKLEFNIIYDDLIACLGALKMLRFLRTFQKFNVLEIYLK